MHKVVQLYYFKPFINNSFVNTLDNFIEYIVDKYDVANVVYKDGQISPDKVKVGGLNAVFINPKELYVKVHFTNDSFKLVSGHGHEYCTCYLNEREQINIHWEAIYRGYDDAIEFTKAMSRKVKLKKLNECRG